jgi:hypothetical protein
MKLLYAILDWLNDRIPCPHKRECSICGDCGQCCYHGAPCKNV